MDFDNPKVYSDNSISDGLVLYQFHAQKALFKVPKISNISFWIENDPPPPLVLFQKFIRFGSRTLPLERSSVRKCDVGDKGHFVQREGGRGFI